MEAEKNTSKNMQSQSQQQPQNQKNQVPNPQSQNQPSGQQEEKKENKPKRAFRIGIIANGMNDEDILYYNEQLKEINKLYREKIRIVVLGYKTENDRLDMLNGVIFEYVKPVTIVHYFKQLASMQIDLLFIPLINNEYNATSENFNKYLEAGVFKIPVIAPDIYPYNKLISSEVNGFVFGNREEFIPYLRDLLHNKLSILKQVGARAMEDVATNFNYSSENIKILSSAFQ